MPPTTKQMSAPSAFVRVRGARQHNLKNVDVDVPRDALVVFSGVSGSGKSSLAFGTLFAEAQRRYLESVAPYARRLIEQVGPPDVDAIDGLPPAIALQQQRGTPSARSTVGTVTTLSSLLRMLYSRAGVYPPKQPMLFAEDFSPNTAQGACPTCHGLGSVYEVNEETMVPDPSLTIRQRAVASWPMAWYGQNLRDILVSMGVDVDVPWRELPKKTRDFILFTDEHPTAPVYPGYTPTETRAAIARNEPPNYVGTFTGAKQYVLQTFSNSPSALMKKRVSRYMRGARCSTCHGKRLKREALSVKFMGLDIAELTALPFSELAKVLEAAARGELGKGDRTRGPARREDGTHVGADDVRRTGNLSAEKRIAAQRIARDVLERTQTLTALGLGYLSLDRTTPTLSAGELQRLRLATQIRSNLFGVVYVMDEPSAGLHPADGEALHLALDQLVAAGNSVFVVEHDLAVMRRAQWLVDVGPDAGERGGRVLYSGPPDGLRTVKGSHTARYLFDEAPPLVRRAREPRGWLELEGITRNNLRGLDARFPLGVLTAVTGISGSGKSSLVSQALLELVAEKVGHAEDADEEAEGPQVREQTGGRIAAGAEGIERLVRVDQKPIGRTPRSNLATYTGLFDAVRQRFASVPLAKQRRWGAGRFSFNVKQGRCETCEGEGFVSVEMLFMASVFAPCPACHGARFSPATLEVKYRGKNVAEVLGLTVDEASAFFEGDDAVHRPLRLLQAIGLGYLRLGQPATELSGGEAQRIKLATELQRSQRGDALYVLDEPSTGLHAADVDKLMSHLQELVDAGNTVVVVEHELRMVAAADWVIDLGPGAGAQGGRIVAEGPPDVVARGKQSRTAPYLRAALLE
ncbi:MAG: excinuclease ABC subunit UvrA [Myxococcaceae bacterium]|nr:excinuclease ABC subunit UvrA [Myxococcaceae bacterium]